jgi:hypothetical protein
VVAHPTIDWTSARLGRPPGVVVVLMCLGGLRRDRNGSYAVPTPDGCLYGLIYDSRFDVILPPPRPLDPINNPEYTRDILSEIAAHGATIISAYFLHKSLGHYLDNLQALAELHPPGGVA